MYVKSKKTQDINFLASSRYQNFTRQMSNEGVTTNSEGKKIVPAGTVYKNDNGVAIGLTFHDVDVTNGSQPVAVMYQGIVYGNRLPAEVSATDKKTMTGILFKDDYDSQTVPVEYIVTTDTTYQEGTNYYSKYETNETNEYVKLIAGTDYTVGNNITGTVYVVKS